MINPNLIKQILIEASMPNQDKVDQLLDKISQGGVESLTRAEKEALNSLSKGKDRPTNQEPEDYTKSIMDYYIDGVQWLNNYTGKVYRKRKKVESRYGEFYEIHFIDDSGETLMVINDYITQQNNRSIEESEATILDDVWDGIKSHTGLDDNQMPNFFDYYFKKVWQMEVANAIPMASL